MWRGYPLIAVASLVVVSGVMLVGGGAAYAVVNVVWFAVWYGIFYAVSGDHTVTGMMLTFWYGIPAAIIMAALVWP